MPGPLPDFSIPRDRLPNRRGSLQYKHHFPGYQCRLPPVPVPNTFHFLVLIALPTWDSLIWTNTSSCHSEETGSPPVPVSAAMSCRYRPCMPAGRSRPAAFKIVVGKSIELTIFSTVSPPRKPGPSCNQGYMDRSLMASCAYNRHSSFLRGLGFWS